MTLEYSSLVPDSMPWNESNIIEMQIRRVIEAYALIILVLGLKKPAKYQVNPSTRSPSAAWRIDILNVIL